MASKVRRKAIIVADSDPAFRRICRRAISRMRDRPAQIFEADDPVQLSLLVSQRPNSPVLLDPALLDKGQVDSVSQIRQFGHQGPLLLCSSESTVSKAMDLVRAGADYVLTKPARIELITKALNGLGHPERKESSGNCRPAIPGDEEFAGFIGKSTEMRAIFAQITSIAKSSAPAFITGESGTGKELCAEAVHRFSARSHQPLISLNCSAIPRELMESEMFGHVKGAFTGATRDRPGAAEIANGGTLFLDEICEMDIALQAKLLRFIQSGTIRRVGGNRDTKVDIRFVCATNRDPLAEVRRGAFREDLFYRLHVIPLHLSPLRHRRADIVPIALRYLKHCATEENSRFSGFSSGALQTLEAMDWPGNVRQLQNTIRRIVVLNDGDLITCEMLEAALIEDHGKNSHQPDRLSPVEEIGGLIQPLSVQERKIIETAVTHCGGNIVEAAKALDISPSTIYRKLQSWQTDQHKDEIQVA